jgi:signal transduction histidine kinase
LRAYKAFQVELFLFNGLKSSNNLEWVCGCRVSEGQEVKMAIAGVALTDELVMKAVNSCQPATERLSVSDQDRANAPAVVKESLVTRACIPLTIEGSVIGAIDIRWSPDEEFSRAIAGRSTIAHLAPLGERIAMILQREYLLEQQEKAQAEAQRSNRALDAMGLMLSQSGHRLMNLLTNISHLPRLISEAEDDSQRENRIGELEQEIETGSATVRRSFDVAHEVWQRRAGLCGLNDIVRGVLIEKDLQAKDIPVEVDLSIPESLDVWVDPDLIRESFSNIVDNAIRAMENGGVLRITASMDYAQDVARIVFQDTGDGMTPDEINCALTGSFSREGERLGIGVLIARLLVELNGGTFTIESAKSVGTKVNIELPTSEPEDKG